MGIAVMIRFQWFLGRETLFRSTLRQMSNRVVCCVQLLPCKIRWRPPRPDVFKINTDDAAQDLGRGRVGMGIIIIHDCSGEVTVVVDMCQNAGYSAPVAEAVALLHGMECALDTWFAAGFGGSRCSRSCEPGEIWLQ
ncbi:hypothetical protein Ddye_020819 [Dipteronia dyeriana]|uniref:RNase H type-1 domain-containing protein n=1 Tax=Dipteronia dyeriana TaxID=168575 RepID=A0AAD9U0F6_9ROSI|nr:hypothetical protein Ddye_020819 [Dipteronia dyeriana]